MAIEQISNGESVQSVTDKINADIRRGNGGNRLRDMDRFTIRAASFGNSIVAGVNDYRVLDVALTSASEKPIHCAVNLGVAGNTTADMIARLSSVVDVDYVLIQEGPNDVHAGVTAQQHRDNLQTILDDLIGKEITPALNASSPRTNYGSEICDYVAMEMALASQYDIDLFDPWAAHVDETTGGWVAADTSDGIHPTNSASVLASTTQADLLDGTEKTPLFAPRTNVSGNSPYLLSGGNCLFLDDSNADGIADGWSTLGAAVAFSIVTAPAGFKGNFQQVVSDGGGGNAVIQRTISGHDAGDELLISFVLDTANLATAPQLTIGITGVKELAAKTRSDTTKRMLLRYTPASAANFNFYFTLANNAAAGELRIGEFEVYNLTKLGL